MKLCPKCKIEKPETEFHKNLSHKDGLASYCKPCCKEKRSNYYNQFAEIERANASNWNKKHKKQRRITKKIWERKSRKKKELKMQFRLITLPTKFISTYEFNPSARTETKALTELENDIKQSKTIVPVYVRQDPEKGYVVIDGNRRLTVAKKLKYDKLQCIISDEQDGSDADYFILLNKQRKLSGLEQMEFAKNTGKFVTKRFEENYNFFLNLGGQDLIDTMLKSRANPTSLRNPVLQVASYLDNYDKSFMLSVAYWLVINRSGLSSRIWVSEGKNKEVLKKCILNNTKLPK